MEMTREQVIEELEALIEGFNEVYEAVPICLGEAVRLLKAEQRPQVEWIPCSERLPEAGQVVIVSDNRGDVYEYTMNPLSVNKYIDDKWTFMGHEILAWMPLPKPYKRKKVKRNETYN